MARKLRMKYDDNMHIGAAQKRRKFKWTLLIILVVLLLLVSNFIFQIRTVTIKGNVKVSSEEIISELGIHQGDNLIPWLILASAAEKDLNPLISKVDIYIHWPSDVEIRVEERNIVGYVAWNGMYLCIDEAGYVVDSTHTLKENIPIITGIYVRNFALGQPLATNSDEIASTAVSVCRALDQFGLTNRIVRIDLTDTDSIRIYTERLEVRIGDSQDLTLKTQALQIVLNETPEASGILHMEDVNGQVYLEKVV